MSQSLLGEVLVARQPILDARLDVVGYELLYRDAEGRGPADADGGGPTGEAANRATATVVVDGVLGLGRSMTTGGEDIYVNLPVELLLRGSLLDLPADGIVLELLADARDTEEIRAAIAEHRAAGFRIALDDVVPDDPRLALADAVDVVKVDMIASGAGGRRLLGDLSDHRLVVLAEKVEDPADFDEVVAAGAQLVQGFFFTRPRAMRGIRPLQLSAEHLDLLRALSRQEVDLAEVERLIRRDLTLTERFLRLVDVATGWRNVDSVRDGLVMLGERSVQRWVALLVMSSISPGAPSELITTASVRARYCEVVEERRQGGRRLEAFALGMFSVLGADGVLDEELLANLPVTDDVRDGLRGTGRLRPLLRLQLAFEAGNWERVVKLGRQLGLTPRDLAAAQLAALRWADEVRGVRSRARTDGAPDGTGDGRRPDPSRPLAS